MRPLILPAILALMTTATAIDAQIMRAIQRKAADAVAQKAEAKLDEKIEQMADKVVNSSFDALFGGFEGPDGVKAPPIRLPGSATTADRYDFPLVVTMQMTVTGSNGRSEPPTTMRMHLAKDGAYTATQVTSAEAKQQGADAIVIFDAANEAMVMLMSSDGKKFSMAYGWREAADAAAKAAVTEEVDWDSAEAWKQWTRIGTKTIAGYSATGYRASDEESTVELWVSRDPVFAGAGWFGANGSTKALKGRLPTEYPTGMLLEMTSTSTRNREAMTMTATSVDPRANVSFVMSEYPRVGAAGK
jgi:hypothetical protein